MQQTTIKRLTRQFPQYFTIVVHTSHTWGQVRLPKRMNFRKTSKGGGGAEAQKPKTFRVATFYAPGWHKVGDPGIRDPR